MVSLSFNELFYSWLNDKTGYSCSFFIVVALNVYRIHGFYLGAEKYIIN